MSAGDGPRWAGRRQPALDAVYILAPHPDDEVLGAAGLMVWAAQHEVPVTIVAITDGEASHGPSSPEQHAGLVETRSGERERALGRLGVRPAAIARLGFPDGDVDTHADQLAQALAELVPPGATVVAPAPSDTHPDHGATWRASCHAAQPDQTLLGMAIWTRVCIARPPTGAHVLLLDPVTLRRKREAVSCFASQTQPFTGRSVTGPVVDGSAVAAMTSPTEWFVP